MLQFEFDGHNSSEYGIIMTGITDNDNLESRSLQLGEKNRYRAKENRLYILEQCTVIIIALHSVS